MAYETTDLRAKLSRWHADVDNAFKGWNGAWLDPDFRNWDITEFLAYIRVPMLIVQGADDQYGTVKQIEAATRECYCPVEVALLPGAKHSPQREARGGDAEGHFGICRTRAAIRFAQAVSSRESGNPSPCARLGRHELAEARDAT